MTIEATVKGASLKGFQAWCAERLGAQEFAQLLQRRFDPDLQLLLTGDLLSSKSYPADQQNRFLAQLAAHFGASADAELRAMGAFCARRDLSGFLKIFLMLFSATQTLEGFGALWHRYQNTGEVRFVTKDSHRYVFEVIDPNNHPMHSVLVAGYVHAALELTGATDVRVGVVHPTGSPTAVFDATWK